jgi:hypothetical protein
LASFNRAYIFMIKMLFWMCPFTGRPIDGMQEKVESAEDPSGGNAFPSFI